MTDEIQTGLGRTGRLFCYEYDGIKPDVLIVGKALGGGCFPVSGTLASKEIMSVFTPGNHGSTFGGNPLACAVGKAAVEVIVEEKLPENSFRMGEYLQVSLRKLNSRHVGEIRGKGLFVGVEIKTRVRPGAQVLREADGAGHAGQGNPWHGHPFRAAADHYQDGNRLGAGPHRPGA